MENPFVESFNGRVRDELPNVEGLTQRPDRGPVSSTRAQATTTSLTREGLCLHSRAARAMPPSQRLV